MIYCMLVVCNGSVAGWLDASTQNMALSWRMLDEVEQENDPMRLAKTESVCTNISYRVCILKDSFMDSSTKT